MLLAPFVELSCSILLPVFFKLKFIQTKECSFCFHLQLQQKEEVEAWKVGEVVVTSSSEGSEREMNFVQPGHVNKLSQWVAFYSGMYCVDGELDFVRLRLSKDVGRITFTRVWHRLGVRWRNPRVLGID